MLVPVRITTVWRLVGAVGARNLARVLATPPDGISEIQTLVGI